MELVPILSLIVLVATIGTFVLAVCAYVMFKIRERKGATFSTDRSGAIEADVLSPGEILEDGEDASGEPDQRVYRPEQKMMKYTADGYVPISHPKPGESKKWR